MRPGLGLLALLLAGTGMAQWRHFGEGAPAAVPMAESKPVARQPVTGLYSMAREMIASHNAVRTRVGTAPLVWSESLAIVAQNWADHLMANGKFEHSHNPNYGENLYEIMGAPATPAEAIKAFADEVKDYDYRSNSCRAGAMCGHYTQVVWNDTKQVGCAVAKGRGREVWVCEYNPPGNWVK